MRAIGLISVIVFLAAAAGPARAADAQEHFVRVTPDGDFALGCNTFMVAGWNQCGLLDEVTMHLPGRTVFRPWRTDAEVAYMPAAQQSASSCAATAQQGHPQPALQMGHMMAL